MPVGDLEPERHGDRFGKGTVVRVDWIPVEKVLAVADRCRCGEEHWFPPESRER